MWDRVGERRPKKISAFSISAARRRKLVCCHGSDSWLRQQHLRQLLPNRHQFLVWCNKLTGSQPPSSCASTDVAHNFNNTQTTQLNQACRRTLSESKFQYGCSQTSPAAPPLTPEPSGGTEQLPKRNQRAPFLRKQIKQTFCSDNRPPVDTAHKSGLDRMAKHTHTHTG